MHGGVRSRPSQLQSGPFSFCVRVCFSKLFKRTWEWARATASLASWLIMELREGGAGGWGGVLLWKRSGGGAADQRWGGSAWDGRGMHTTAVWIAVFREVVRLWQTDGVMQQQQQQQIMVFLCAPSCSWLQDMEMSSCQRRSAADVSLRRPRVFLNDRYWEWRGTGPSYEFSQPRCRTVSGLHHITAE